MKLIMQAVHMIDVMAMVMEVMDIVIGSKLYNMIHVMAMVIDVDIRLKL